MRALPIFAAAVLCSLAAWARAADVNGVVIAVAGQRVTLDTSPWMTGGAA